MVWYHSTLSKVKKLISNFHISCRLFSSSSPACWPWPLPSLSRQMKRQLTRLGAIRLATLHRYLQINLYLKIPTRTSALITENRLPPTAKWPHFAVRCLSKFSRNKFSFCRKTFGLLISKSRLCLSNILSNNVYRTMISIFQNVEWNYVDSSHWLWIFRSSG